jgi:hypothetical protein
LAEHLANDLVAAAVLLELLLHSSLQSPEHPDPVSRYQITGWPFPVEGTLINTLSQPYIFMSMSFSCKKSVNYVQKVSKHELFVFSFISKFCLVFIRTLPENVLCFVLNLFRCTVV